MEAICFVANPGALPANPVSDSLSNTWTLVNKQIADGDVAVELWISFGPRTGNSQSFRGSGEFPAIAAMAFSGVASGPDQNSSASKSSSGSITPTNAYELLISCMGTQQRSVTAVNSPFTLLDQGALVSGPLAEGFGSAYQVQKTARSENATWPNALAVSLSSFYSTQAPAPLTVTTTSLAEGFNGGPYSLQLQSRGGVSPFMWTQTAGTLPIGLSFSPGGLISGTPTQTVLNDAETFQVTDSNSSRASSGGLAITIAARAPSITTTTCPSGGQYLSYTGCKIAATGGTRPYIFSIGESPYASLPEGLSLDSATGVITSSQIGGQGTYGVQFIATDSKGATSTRVINLGISGSNCFFHLFFRRILFFIIGSMRPARVSLLILHQQRR